MMKSINWTVFILSFLIGLVFIYLSSSPNEEVYVYPTPENAGTIEYKDKANNCFVYQAKSQTCPKSDIKYIPIQE